jgi:hypothetical protein
MEWHKSHNVFSCLPDIIRSITPRHTNCRGYLSLNDTNEEGCRPWCMGCHIETGNSRDPMGGGHTDLLLTSTDFSKKLQRTYLTIFATSKPIRTRIFMPESRFEIAQNPRE